VGVHPSAVAMAEVSGLWFDVCVDTSDILSLVGVIVAVAAAGIAGWQAREARKARIDSVTSATAAAESASIAAEAQKKLAEIEEGRAAQQRRKLDVEWHREDIYVVINRTGEPVTDVTVEGSGDRPATEFRRGSWERIDDQDSETYFGQSGQVTASWTDVRGERQTRMVQVRREDK